MKSWEEMTPEEQTEEFSLTLHSRNELGIGASVIIPFEVNLLLLNNIGGYGLYVALLFLEQNKFLSGLKLEALSLIFGFDRKSLSKYLKKLEELKIIRFEPDKNNWKRKNIVFNRVRRLEEKDIDRLQKVVGSEAQIKLLQELREKIHPVTPEELQHKAQEIKETEQKTLIDGLVAKKVKEEKQKEQAKKKAEEEKFPNADYISVITGYKKSKGVGVMPHSPEEMRLRRSIKLMFRSGYSVYDILKCMEFFKAYSNKDGYSWMTHWTMETIYKKIGEFKAGKLKRPEIGDDIPEA